MIVICPVEEKTGHGNDSERAASERAARGNENASKQPARPPPQIARTARSSHARGRGTNSSKQADKSEREGEGRGIGMGRTLHLPHSSHINHLHRHRRKHSHHQGANQARGRNPSPSCSPSCSTRGAGRGRLPGGESGYIREPHEICGRLGDGTSSRERR